MTHPRLLTSLLAAACITLMAVTCSTAGQTTDSVWVENPDCEEVNRSPLRTEQLTLQVETTTVEVNAEIAMAIPERLQGFQCRSFVRDGFGMLFEFPSKSSRGFWMYNTYVPLDLVYFDHTGLAIAGTTLQPCPRRAEEPDAAWRTRCMAKAEPHTPAYPYLFVLETPAGWLASQGLPLTSVPGSMELLDR